jgi:hypothetical protein
LSARRRRFGTGTVVAMSRGKDGSFGPRPRRVLGDVGVRFGGSEHHRIETSSSHTRPPPYWAGLPATGTKQTALLGAPPAPFHRGTANGAFRGTARTASPGQGTAPLRRRGPPLHPGHGKRHSSEHRAHGLTGTGNPALFGASGPPPHRDREPDLLGGSAPHPNRGTADGTLRSAARTASPGQGTSPLRRRGPPSRTRPEPTAHVGKEPRPPGHGRRHSSERRAHGLAGTRQTAPFGAPRARLHRDRADGAPRGTASPAPSGQGTGPPRRTGPPSHRVRTLSRDGHPAHWGRADGAPRSTARHASPGPRPRAPRSPGDRPHRSREPGPPRRPGAPASARTGTSSLTPATGASRGIARQDPGLESRPSSEARTPHLTGHRPPRPSGQGHRRLAGRDQRTVRHPPRRTGGRQRPSTSVGDPRRAGR